MNTTASRRRGGADAGTVTGPARRARIVTADHDRLVVSYCPRDHAVYVLTPPGQDPQLVLRAACVVVPEDAYRQLADHLGLYHG